MFTRPRAQPAPVPHLRRAGVICCRDRQYRRWLGSAHDHTLGVVIPAKAEIQYFVVQSRTGFQPSLE
jgi:hypothetical protein